MEPGWVVALCGALTAVTATVSTLTTNWWNSKRVARQDEVAVLHTSIAELRQDRDSLHDEFAAYRKTSDAEKRQLKDDHTACLLLQARQDEKIHHQDEKIAGLEARIRELENGTHSPR